MLATLSDAATLSDGIALRGALVMSVVVRACLAQLLVLPN